MAWYSDEEYEYRRDVMDKSITARSARRTRTHNGKSGPVKFPSDYLTAKERKAMNGECKTWNMNKPMSYADFKEMPDDLKVQYIKMLRHRFDIPDTYIAEMMGVSRRVMGIVLRDLKCTLGKGSGHAKWKKDEFEAWCRGEEVVDIPAEETTLENTPVEPVEAVEAENTNEAIVCTNPPAGRLGDTEGRQNEFKPIIPESGTMTFEASADQILETMKTMFGNTRVILIVNWTVVEEG